MEKCKKYKRIFKRLTRIFFPLHGTWVEIRFKRDIFFFKKKLLHLDLEQGRISIL